MSRKRSSSSQASGLPTAREINPYDDLDGRDAERHFLGKTLDEAFALFSSGFYRYQEDLMFMGPVAFRYYLPAAVRHVESAPDCSIPSDDELLLCVLKFHWEWEREELAPLRELISAYCRGALERAEQSSNDETWGPEWGPSKIERILTEYGDFIDALLAGSESARDITDVD